MNQDEAAFRKEIDTAVKFMKKQMGAAAKTN
jgi:hypothetical protein